MDTRSATVAREPIDICKETAGRLYSSMFTIRRFEQNVGELYAAGDIPGFLHLYIGEEAVAVGVCSTLRTDDYICSTHRGHGHCIAKGARLDYMMAELFGRSTGYCKGKGGSMHIADLDIGILGANGIVGGGVPMAVGAGVGIQYKGEDKVSVSFFGDGATNIGPFHEACNLAATWQLPVIFVCENNSYAQTTPRSQHQRIKTVADRAGGYGMASVTIDGNNVIEVQKTLMQAVERARQGKGPTFVECNTYRWNGHWEGDPQPYRTKEEIEQWKLKCPIVGFKKHLLDNKILTEEDFVQIEKEVEDNMEQAIEFARKSPFPKAEEALEDIYTV